MSQTAADRQRRYRRRQARRVTVYRVQAGDGLLFALLASGRMTDAQALDREAVEREVGKLLAEWASSWWK